MGGGTHLCPASAAAARLSSDGTCMQTLPSLLQIGQMQDISACSIRELTRDAQRSLAPLCTGARTVASVSVLAHRPSLERE